MEKVGLDRLVAVCLEAGRKACGLIRTIHSSGDLQCVEKGDGRDTLTGRPMRDIQTEADRQSEWIIFATLRHHFPNLKIVGEEESSGFQTPPGDEGCGGFGCDSMDEKKVLANIPPTQQVALEDICMFVDPLDGTSEFVNGRLHCVSVLIGIAHQQRAIAGVICRPFPSEKHPGECLYGVVGLGAFLDHKQLPSFPPTASPSLTIVTTLSRHHRVIDRLFQLLPQCSVLKEGGAGWKCWLVAIGQADCYAYPRAGTKLWDVLAGDAILAALTGVTTDACGRSICYSTSQLGNVWGIMLSRNRNWHFDSLILASHRALTEAAADPENPHWPHGLPIPERNSGGNSGGGQSEIFSNSYL